MSDLTVFRDHCRARAEALHREDCSPKVADWHRLPCTDIQPHDAHDWAKHDLPWRCPGRCGGCLPESERALWTRLADEIDDHLSPDDEPLFESEGA